MGTQGQLGFCLELPRRWIDIGHTSDLCGNDLVGAAASAGQRGIGVVDLVRHGGGRRRKRRIKKENKVERREDSDSRNEVEVLRRAVMSRESEDIREQSLEGQC